MISVVIPTLGLVKELNDNLKDLSLCPYVGEIILIDNTENSLPVKINKVRHVLEGENTFVNPAWNKGVEMAKYDKLLIINDDTWFDWDLIKQIEPHINEASGMIGISSKNYKIQNQANPIKLQKTGKRPMGFACAFFIHKDNWSPIPEEMKIWGGDEWLFLHLQKRGIQNYRLINLKVSGSISTTIQQLYKDEKMKDLMIKDSILANKIKK